jgi:cytochrome P450
VKPLAPGGVDPYAQGFLENPWAAYRSLHEAGPLLWNSALRVWLVPGHAASRKILRDPGIFTSSLGRTVARLGERGHQVYPSLCGILESIPFYTNPPEHAQMRRLFVSILAARPISGHMPAMREIAERVLQKAHAPGRFDLVLDFADTMPPLFMAQLLGIPQAELPALRTLTDGVIQIFNRVLHLREYAELDRRIAEALALLRRIAAERRRAPQDDGISRLIAGGQDDRPLDDEQIARYCYVLFAVGVETTSTLIGSALRLLLEHPGSCEALRADRALLPSAVEEFLRCEAPVQSAARIAMQEVELDGTRIAPGERVVVMLGAANRDPAVYAEPDLFDVRRKGPAHLSFGDGSHICVGATLARAEARIALEAFLDLPRPCRRVRDTDRWWSYDWMRRLRELPVEFAS